MKAKHLLLQSAIIGLHAASATNSYNSTPPTSDNVTKHLYIETSGANGGYDEGLFFETMDRMYSIKFNLLTQNRFVYDSRSGSPINPAFHNVWDFENTRDMFNFSGTVAGNGYYNLRTVFGSHVLIPTLNWAYGGWSFDSHWNFAAGLMRLPLSREWCVNEEFQLAIERAYTTSVIDGRAPGLQVGYSADMWRFNAYFTNGETGVALPATGKAAVDASAIASILDAFVLDYASFNDTWLLGGRFDWIFWPNSTGVFGQGPDSSGRLATGNWARFQELTSPWDEKITMLAGIWFSYSDLHLITPPLGTKTVRGHFWRVTADLQAQLGGGSVYALAWAMPNRIETVSDITLQKTTPWGFLVQGAAYVLPSFELLSRFEFADWYQGPTTTLATLPAHTTSILTAGFNWYPGGQNFKISTNYSFSWNPLSNTVAAGTVGATNWQGDLAQTRSQQLLQIQLQTFF